LIEAVNQTSSASLSLDIPPIRIQTDVTTRVKEAEPQVRALHGEVRYILAWETKSRARRPEEIA
jgi:hypothetical protein